MNEMERAIAEEVEKEFSKIIKKSALKVEPKHSLVELLADKSFHKLKELAKLHRIPRCSVLQKEELISMLEKALTETERIEACLFMADDRSLEDLIALSKTLQLECSAITCARLDFYARLGMIQVFYFEDKFLVVMPQEIRQVVETVCTPSFMKKKKRDSLLLHYALACVNLYGFISQDEFVALFNKQNADSTDIDEVFSTLIHHVSMDSEFCFWDEYIVSADLEEDDFESLTHLIEATEGKPRYIPGKKQLLKYADSDFYEETIYTKQLEQHLKILCKAEHIAEDLTDEICYLATRDVGFDDMFNATTVAGVDFESMEGVQAFGKLLMNLKNNTRIWVNKGHTPNEMHTAFAKKSTLNVPSKALPFPAPAKSQKVGRNDPCPCGSGKKYKKCCGK